MQQELSLDEVREIQVQVLKAFATYCITHDLKFSLYGGTLLGCVRNQGYIPWDDDIDLVMLRQDYDRLCQLARDPGAIDGYSLYCVSSSDGYPFPFAKIASDTTLCEEVMDIQLKIGVNIDVFPIDGVPNGKLIKGIYLLKMRMLRAFMVAAYFSNTRAPYSGLRSRMLPWLKPVSRLLGLRRLVVRAERAASEYSLDSAQTLVVAVWGSPNPIPVSAFNSFVLGRFEDSEYPMAVGYDLVLTSLYGDYLVLPPIEQQVRPHSFRAYNCI